MWGRKWHLAACVGSRQRLLHTRRLGGRRGSSREGATSARHWNAHPQTATARAVNVVMVGAAAELLPIGPERIEAYIREAFARKGSAVAEANVRAFRLGRETVH